MGGQLSKQELSKALAEQLGGSGVSFLSKSDRDTVLDTLAVAFADDPMFTWVAGLDDDDPERDKKMYELGRIMFAYHSRNGVALGVREGPGNELVGCATLAPSSCHRESAVDVVLVAIEHGVPPIYKRKESGGYGPRARERLESLGVLTKIRAAHMKDTEKWAYLQSGGVRLGHRGKGHGKRMMSVLIRMADSSGISLYLETESEELESLYKRVGFRTLEKLNLCVPGDTSPTANLVMYCMRRDPSVGSVGN